MLVGVPREIKDFEQRVALTPVAVDQFVRLGHDVLVETGAGAGSGFSDADYWQAGAQILDSPADLYRRAELVLKVKEPLPPEYPLLQQGQVLFTYLHLAAAPDLAHVLLERQVIAIAYETIAHADGTLPLLQPMSEIAGRMSIQVAAHFLEHPHGGRGKLLGGVPGVFPSRIVVVGAGTVGTNAAQIAVGMGGHVTVLDRRVEPLRRIAERFGTAVTTVVASHHTIATAVRGAEVVIGAVLVPGERAPIVVTREMVETMAAGSVIVDVAIDQGGCVETSEPTTHASPTRLVRGIIHYAVPNMPGAVPRTSTYALCNAVLPYALRLAEVGPERAIAGDSSLARGLNCAGGHITHPGVAAALGQQVLSPVEALAARATPALVG